jgi:hypothetical protein
MRAREFVVEKRDQQVDEILPVLGAAAGALGRGALSLGGAAVRAAPGAMRKIGSIGGDVLGAAGDVVGGAARGVGRAIGGIAQGAGDAVGGIVGGIRSAAGGGDVAQGKPQQLPRPGGTYNHPSLGPVSVLPPAPGQRGIKLDTRQKLGFPIIVDPKDLQQSS